MNQRWKHNLNITVIAALLTKLSEFWRLEFEIFIEVWFGYIAQHLRRTATYYKIPNVKRGGTKHNSNWKRQKGGK